MKANRPYSKSLRLFVHKSPPIQLSINKYIKRSPSFSKEAILYEFPQLKTKRHFNLTNAITSKKISTKANLYRDDNK